MIEVEEQEGNDIMMTKMSVQRIYFLKTIVGGDSDSVCNS